MKKLLLISLTAIFALTSCGLLNPQSSSSEMQSSNVSVSESDATSLQEEKTEAPTEASTEAPNQLPIEVKSFSHIVKNGYLYFAACLHNPNENYYVQYPHCRVTARDENGGVLGTEEFGLMGLYPNMEAWDGGQLFSVEKEPATVDVEVIKPNDYDYIEKSLTEFPNYKEMTVINTNIIDDGFKKKLVGEIQNDNDFDVKCVALTIVFLDEAGNPIAADRTFVDDVYANSTTPFETSLWVDFITDNYKTYADLWY